MSSTDIEEAIKAARYNEAVIVTIPAEDDNGTTSPRELVLVATLDEENGGITWKDVLAESSNNEDDGSTSIAQDIALQRHLRTKRWFLPMLNDHRRSEMYDMAIAKAARKAAANVVNGKRPVLKVLDIGTGTGLLAMMAAKHCRSALDELVDGSDVKIQVTSIEMASAMARLGRLTIAENGLEDVITVVEGHSSDPNFDMMHEIDLCTSELLESGLLGEGVLPALRDAWSRHLRPDAAVVPVRARVYAQVLEGKDTVACFRGPSVPDPCPEDRERLCMSAGHRDVLLGGPGRGGIRYPIRGEALFEKLSPISPLCDYELAKKLSDPVKVLDFDFSDPNSFPMEAGRSMNHSVQAVASGTAHGVLFWWELDMEDELTYSTEPKSKFQDHWQQCLWVFGQDNDQCRTVAKGEKFNLCASHNNYGISFYIDEKKDDVGRNDEAKPPLAKQQKVEQTDDSMNEYISPDRAMQLNDTKRMDAFRDTIISAISAKRESKVTTMLHLGDFSLGAIIAGINANRTENCLQISSIESSSGSLPITAATVAQIGNGLPREGHVFQILQAHTENLTLPVIDPGGKGSLDIVCAEPYYEMLEGWHVQEALNLFYTIRMLRQKGLMQPHTSVLPLEARIMGCAIQVRDLGNAYTQHVHSLSCSEGALKHETAMEHAARYHTFSANFPLWQYRHQLMSEPFEIARISYTDKILGSGEWKSRPLTQDGICHGIAYWADFVVRSEDGSEKIISTFNRSHKQLVRFLRPGIIVSEEDIQKGIRLACKMTFGGLEVCEDHDLELRMAYRNNTL